MAQEAAEEAEEAVEAEDETNFLVMAGVEDEDEVEDMHGKSGSAGKLLSKIDESATGASPS